MKNRSFVNTILIFAFLFSACRKESTAQDTFNRKGTWAITAATGVVLSGLSKGYNVSYASNDGGRSSGYDVTPITTFQGYFEVSRFKPLNKSFFLSYGAGYKISRNEVEYEGYSECSSCYTYVYSIIDYGNRLSEYHYLSTYLITYFQYDFGRDNHSLLNGLGIRSDFLINENYRYQVKGYDNSDPLEPAEYFENQGNDSRWFPEHFQYFSKLSTTSPPYIKMYYELGYGFKIDNKIRLILSIETSLWNLNNLWEKDRHILGSSLFWYDNKKFKEFIIRITINFNKTK